jgi:hypothetical protein
VLKAYLDASGTTDSESIVAVAGWAATEAEWDKWEQQWVSMLNRLNLRRWHHTYYNAKRKEYERWNDAEFDLAHRMLREIFESVHLFGIGVAFRRSDYNNLWKTGRWNIPNDPYLICVDHCLEALIHRIHEYPNDEGIEVYVDKDKDMYEKLGTRIVDWHRSYLRHNHKARNPNRRVSVTYGYNSDYRPLEAADVLVNEAARYMRRGIAPFVGARQPNTAPDYPPIIGAMKKRSILVVECWSKQNIEFQLELAANNQVRIDGLAPDGSVPRSPSIIG